jgi:hypothetical protein
MHVDTDPWFAIADDPDLSYEAKLERYQQLADQHFDKERYLDFCATALPEIDDLVLEWVASPDFERMLTETVNLTYPEHERERFLNHFRGLVGLWVSDQKQVSV